MKKKVEFLQKNLSLLIPAVMIAGIIYGLIFKTSNLKVLIVPLTFLMVYPMMVGLNLKELFSNGGKKANLLALIINFGVMPFTAFFIGKYFWGESSQIYLLIGLLLSALLPTSGMTISWTGFARGNIHSAIKMTIIGLIAGSILAPIYINFLVGAEITVPFSEVFSQIAVIVFMPMSIGNITQRFLIKKYGAEHFKKEIKTTISSLSTIGVLGIVFVVMALKATVITANPKEFFIYFIPILILYMLNFFISTVAGKIFLSRGDAIALVYGTVMRNLSIALALAMAIFKEKGADAAVIISTSYIVQVQSAALYVKFTDKIFGKGEHK